MIRVPPDGPIPSRIMLIGEAPGVDEELKGSPFVGVSGIELNKMLHEAGIMRSECFLTNVCPFRPPQNDIEPWLYDKKKDIPKGFIRYRDMHIHPAVYDGIQQLKAQIEEVKPNVIIAFGNVPLWVLTGRWGITKWRGSMLTTDSEFKSIAGGTGSGAISYRKVIPTIHPAAVLREWSYRAAVLNDLRRAKRFITGEPYPTPPWQFTLRPSYAQAISTLEYLEQELSKGKLRISFDLETRAGHIACAGISYHRVKAICIPFMCVENKEGYWPEYQEAEIIDHLRRVLTHRNAEVIGQNGLYDAQYTYRHWLFVPRFTQDTMIAQHSLFSDQPKNLGYIASIYCDYYVYWKDEGKEWNPKMGEEQLWYYNCEDCVYTDEASQVLERMADTLGLRTVYDAQQKMFWPVLQAMQAGVRINEKTKGDLVLEVQDEVAKRQQFLIDVLGHPINPASPKQMQALFYDDLKLPVQWTRPKKGKPAHRTCDDDALQKLVAIQPLIKPLYNAIADIRTLGQFLSNFLLKPLDIDRRMRCAYNIGGSESGKSAPKTYRLSSSENAFGSGGNLQNIPSEKSKSVGKAAARGGIPSLGDPYAFPNIRSMFVPDPGFLWFDGDLDRADLQVVAWEAEDEMLKAALRLGVDIHLLNAFILVDKEPPPLEELIETHPRYRDHRGPLKSTREFAKTFCHGTNYGGKARTMAANTGRTVHEIDRAQRIWFGAHPGIERWQKRIKDQATKYRFVENKFGYRWYIFDRVEGIIPECIAWIPQATVSNLINKIWRNIYETLPDVQVRLQVHDSLVGQVPKSKAAELIPKIIECAKIAVPYEDPLIIPFSVKTSEVSWGDVH